MTKQSIAVRAYKTQKRRRPAKPASYRRPETLLVFDTETTVDAAQALTFGSYRVYRRRDGCLGKCPEDYRLIEEGLFTRDDLPQPDLSILKAHAREHAIPCLTRRDFIRKIFIPWAFEREALVVGFNLPFDISRIAAGWGTSRRGRGSKESEGRRRNVFASGFSFFLDEYENQTGRHPNKFFPRVGIKTIDSKRHIIGFLAPKKEGKQSVTAGFQGNFLDLRTLAFSLTNKSHSLASACEDFDVEHSKLSRVEHEGQVTPEYIEYNRRDVLATFELGLMLLNEYDAHSISPGAAKTMRSRHQLPETRTYSPASVGKAYLRAMGVTPVLERQPDFPTDVLARGMMAFFGGRTECRVRRSAVPVVYLDFLSMYPTVNALMGLWAFQTATSIEVHDATLEIQEFLARVTLDDLFRQETWPELTVLVEVQPEGDVLPVRASYDSAGQDWQIGVNPLTSEQPLWYSLADVVASKLKTGRAPKILSALRLSARGDLRGLHSVSLRGAVDVNPGGQDFFGVVIEERKRLDGRQDLSLTERERSDAFLKVFANATSYGIFAEVNRRALPSGETAVVEVLGLDGPFENKTKAVEEPGEYFFSPFAALITGAARLTLMMLEQSVADLGGTYAMCDTDSMAIVATEEGGLLTISGTGHDGQPTEDVVQALSWDQVERIRGRFADLNPYDQDAVPGSVLKLEDLNFNSSSGEREQLYCFAISAKRYCLLTLDGKGEIKDVRKPLEHGLGHLMNPLNDVDRDWIGESWRALAQHQTPELDFETLPAVTRITASTPHMLEPFTAHNAGKPYDQRVKPFNFLLSAHVAPLGNPPGSNPKRFHLVAPYERDCRKWARMKWFDRHSGKTYRVKTSGQPSQTAVVVKSYGDVLAEYATHPESKSLGPDGKECSRLTIGRMKLRPVEALPFGKGMSVYIGKEANRLEDVQSGQVHDLDEVLDAYEDPRRDDWFDLILPQLQAIPRSRLAEVAGMSRTQITEMVAGRSIPRHDRRARLTRLTETAP